MVVEIGTTTLVLPGNWEEVNEEQYKTIIEGVLQGKELEEVIMNLLQGDEMKAFETLVTESVIPDVVTGASFSEEDEKGMYYASAVLSIKKKMGWMMKPSKHTDEVVARIKTFSHKGKKYRLPEPNGNDVNFAEFALLTRLLRTQRGAKMLLSILAILAREEGQEERDFDPRRIERRKKEFGNVPIAVFMAAKDYTERLILYVVKRYPKVFEGKTSKGNGFGFVGLRNRLAAQGGGIVDTVQIDNMNIKRVMSYVTQMIIERDAKEN